MKTVELEKTIYRIGTLLQKSFGQLGALIIKKNVDQGDHGLNIMIPGYPINAILMVVHIKDYIQIYHALGERTTEYLNKIILILHECADRWSGWANKNEGDKYLLSWELPVIEEGDSEKIEQLLESRTELADKSLIAAVKIVSEMRRDMGIAKMSKNQGFLSTFGPGFKPRLTFGLHMG